MCISEITTLQHISINIKSYGCFITFASCLTAVYGALPWSGSGGPLCSKHTASIKRL